jgi:hypothetical protein
MQKLEQRDRSRAGGDYGHWKLRDRALPIESINTVLVGLNSWFPTHSTKNVKWMGHGASLYDP